MDALGFFAASRGVRGALVACPNLEEARNLAGMLTAAGYQGHACFNGKELLSEAARSPDYELALIDVTIDRPAAGTLLQQLRHDPRTASLRVGLIARAGYFERAEHLAQSDPLAKAFARPHDDQAFRWQLDQLAAIEPQESVGFEVRQRQAARALDLLAELSRSSGKLYDLRRVQDSVIAALGDPRIAAKAVGVLANLNSAEAQRALVDLASRATQPLALRQAAAAAFRQNVQAARRPLDRRGNPPTIRPLQPKRETGPRHATGVGSDPRLPRSLRAGEEIGVRTRAKPQAVIPLTSDP